MDKLDINNRDILGGNVEKIAELFPGVVTEAADEATGELRKVVDFDLLRQHLSDELVEGDRERFRLDWPGKKASILKANTPIHKTLRPVREDSEDFDSTQNVFIEGDNFEVLKVLQESYLGKVKMIYIDPPYNTGKDFIYRDNFTQDREDYEEEIGVRDDESGSKLVKNTETNGRYHSDWLSMMQERLIVARDLLTDDGVIFMSIDDNELMNLKKLADEVFGESNFINTISIKAKASSGASGGGEDKRLKKNIEYLLVYSRSDAFSSFRPVHQKMLLENYISIREAEGKNFAYTSVLVNEGKEVLHSEIKAGNGDPIRIYKLEGHEVKSISQVAKEEGILKQDVYNKYIDRIFTLENAQTSIRDRVINATGADDEFYIAKYIPKSGKNKDIETKVGFMGKTKRLVSYLVNLCLIEDGKVYKQDRIGTLWDDLSWSSTHLEGGVSFQNGKKPVTLIKRLLDMQTNGESIILDFFSGSATTAHATMELNAEDGGNRKHIQVQLPEPTYKLVDGKEIPLKESAGAYSEGFKSIPEISRERIRRAGKKIREDYAEQIAKRDTPLDTGFRAYKLSSSNFKDTAKHPDQIDQTSLLADTDSIKTDRTADDLLTEVILSLGLTLDLPIETRDIAGHTVYFVGGNSLVACFDDTVSLDIVDDIAAEKPLRVVFKDSSFANDETRINIDIRLKQLSPDTTVQVV